MPEYRVNIGDSRGTLPTTVRDANSAVEAAALSIAANWDRGRAIDFVAVAEGMRETRRLNPADQARAVSAALASPQLVRSGNNGFGGQRVDPASLTAQREAVRAALNGGGVGAQFGATVSNPGAAEATGMLAEVRRAASASQSGTGNS